jgi:hypothetical protein
MARRASVIDLVTREASLRRRVRRHLKALGFSKTKEGLLAPPRLDKDAYREMHAPQRRERLAEEQKFLSQKSKSLIEYFANGREIDIDRINVRLELIDQQCWQSDLFRFASLLWSVPVSYGFGRRMRYLVWDQNSGKLVGLFALGDPVFNLRARDEWVGWNAEDRGRRLVHLLDGYVIGAVPPFNQILGGKLVAALMRTKEVALEFRERYGGSTGIISGDTKNAHLVAITTTSALGRSSVYNRLSLDGVTYLRSIGFTGGFGHFHFPGPLFQEMRAYLKLRKHKYADSHQYGDGPNWRLRTIREALRLLDMDPKLVRHGLAREVFVSCLADNALDILRGKRKRPKYDSLLSAEEVMQLAAKRWLRPRAERDATYRLVTREDTLARIQGRVIDCLPNSPRIARA